MIRRYLDLLTNKVTMYRLALYCLLILAGAAILFSAVNVLPYDPIYMTIGLVVLVVSGLIVNFVFSFAFGRKPNFESVYITTLILFFLFNPASSPQYLIILAIVAALAMASKYLLVWRGRHVFNPAAAGAVIIGLTNLQFASWWVATGVLLPITFVLGGLVLYKTRRLRMALVFVATSIAAILLVKFFSGGSVATLLPIILTSYPLIFFAAFMLSEPLTQPPRNYQRYIFAIGVALIANAQLHIAPEIALVIGNLYAFLCSQRGSIRLKFVSKRELGAGQVEYSFEPKRPVHYQAGQYIEIQVPHRHADGHGERRMFTITSSPHEKLLRIAVRHYDPSSTFKLALGKLKEGAILRATGIYGDFLLPKNRQEKVLFIAGGIGITPFHSHMEWLLHQREERDGILLYSVRNESDAVYKETRDARAHGIKTVVVTEILDQAAVKKYVPDIKNRTVYISGPPGMVSALESTVRRLGAKKIVKDYFSGY